MNHDIVEKNVGLMAVLIIIVISIAGLVQIVPLMSIEETTKPIEGLVPLNALQLEGRDIYIRDGCHVCHTQMIRPFRSETERYGHYSVAGEFIYDRPFLFGSKRTGPDLARVGGRYSDDWHRVHLMNPRDVVPESNMPNFPWLAENILDGELTGKKMEVLSMLANLTNGVEIYSEEDIKNAKQMVAGKTELDALVAYLQNLGTVIQDKR
jgi:cytochrome c oxidase cbb3-type subunit 2